VLIQERMREEAALGRKGRAVISNGYSKAFITILDSNVTTLIAGVILYVIGTGPVRGFAVTLIIGILTSMWTSLFVTRAIFDSMCQKDSFTEIKMLPTIPKTHIDFIGKMWYAMGVSTLVIAIGCFSFFHKGWRNNFGVDFTGGALQQFRFEQPVKVPEIRAALKEIGLQEPLIQNVESGRELIIKTASDKSKDMTDLFKKQFPNNPATLLRCEIVGPVVGRALRQQAVMAVVVSFLAIGVYVWWRFRRPPYGVAAIISLVHDVLVTVAFLSITNRPIDLQTIAALLTIVGFSINDTIVIFDRIREDLKVVKRTSFFNIINLAINQCLARTLLTTLTAIVTVLAIFLWGGTVLHDFSFALLVGFVEGIYSTYYIAATTLILWPSARREMVGA
jgi:SecD/SecF fusion protein